MATRFVLTVAVFQLTIWDCCAVNGIIWRKRQQEFVQLFSIPEFAALQRENLAKHRAIEMQNMRGEVVKAVYYEVPTRGLEEINEKNMVMFHDNDTKLDGIIGDLWHLLEDYLNFTFIPIKTTDRNFGERLENGSQNGLIGMLARNEAQVVMRSAFYPAYLDVVDYTTPLWESKFHIYVRPEWLSDNTWIFTLFSWQMWLYILSLFAILSCVGYYLQKVPMDKPKHKREDFRNFSLGDHVFYSFTIMSARGHIPDAYYNKFKILSISKSIFAWLILLAFSSHLIYIMTNKKMELPFKDIESLINNTKYVLLADRGTFLYNYLKQKYGARIGNHPFARVRFIEIAEDMHNEICNNMKKYAMFEIEDQFMAMNRNGCPLRATGNYNHTWITFALQKNYRYKKTINSALIKFKEVGLLDGLEDRWFNIRLDHMEREIFKMVDFHQVNLIFLILSYGVLISLVILVLENITYYYNMKIARR
ncbi:PREDICTED: glutamate receptor 2-like [Vollenhovia emeryi]|uniref:glutamate receptor 2-like n=1 Tax=Vollenhovia emeryi TaxID=411798 RepID=UPI0005F42E9F|nr:PREDICTED: glutamate receptor 2-like [Vollenhovia emeryi]